MSKSRGGNVGATIRRRMASTEAHPDGCHACRRGTNRPAPARPDSARNSRRDQVLTRPPEPLTKWIVHLPPPGGGASGGTGAAPCAVVRPIVISVDRVAKSVTFSLGDTHLRPARQRGLHLIQPRGEAGAETLASWRLRLAQGESATFCRTDEEAIVVLQQGRATWTAGSETWTVSRSSVF